MRPVDRTLRWLPAILMMAAIFLFSSIPSTEMPSFGFWDLLVKKGGHATGYGLLALSFWFALKWDRRWIWLAFVLTALYAGSDEFHQSFVLGRAGFSRRLMVGLQKEKVRRFFASHFFLLTCYL
jgi:VanZ family protein